MSGLLYPEPAAGFITNLLVLRFTNPRLDAIIPTMPPSLRSSKVPILLAAALIFAALLVRLVDITDAPLEVHPTRQMRAALIARAFYYPTNPQIPAEQVEFALQQREQAGVIEPPILEFLTAQLYRLNGAEEPWLGRLISIAFWLASGWAVYDLTSRISSKAGGLLALAYYLFLPFGLRFSRTLLPDPIMVAGSVASLWALYRWQHTRKTSWAAAAGAITGLAILVKSVAGIILILPFAVYILSTIRLRDALKNRQVWLIFLLAALPSAAYYFWGLVLDGRLATQFSGRFFPDLWTDLLLYKSWGKRIILEFGLPAFLLAILGIVLAKDKALRRMLFVWWAGYFLYGMTFAYHIMTHDYYHLPMVPLTAVSLGIAVSAAVEFARQRGWEKPAMVVLALVGIGYTVYGSVSSIRFFNQTDYRQTRQAWIELGETLDRLPDGRVIALTEDYETSLKFYTFRNAGHWPHLGDLNYFELQGSQQSGLEDRWQQTEGAGYFLVADFKELARQPVLAEKLEEFPVILENEFFALYDLQP